MLFQSETTNLPISCLCSDPSILHHLHLLHPFTVYNYSGGNWSIPSLLLILPFHLLQLRQDRAKAKGIFNITSSRKPFHPFPQRLLSPPEHTFLSCLPHLESLTLLRIAPSINDYLYTHIFHFPALFNNITTR